MSTRSTSQMVQHGYAMQSDLGDAEQRQTRCHVLAALEWAGRRASEWERVFLCDRVELVAPLFASHVRELEAQAVTAAGLGAGAGAVLGGAWGASRHETATSVNTLLKAAVVGAALGAAGGFVAGRAYERAYGRLRPRVAATLPLWAEDRLRCAAIAHVADGACPADVPAWRVEGWRAAWAALAAEYAATAMGAITQPPGAPSLYELLCGTRRGSVESSRF